MELPRTENCDAWVLLQVRYFNEIHHHVARDGPAPNNVADLMTLSTRIVAYVPEGLWVATKQRVEENGQDTGKKDGKFLIPWRYVEGVHVLDEDVPGHKIGKAGFQKKPD